MAQLEAEIVRWYTHGRKFPKLIGRFNDGRAIPGGPYTHTQFATGAVMVAVAAKTPGLWAHFGLLGNAVVLAGTTFVVVWSLGRMPLEARNPIAAGKGAYRATRSPSLGTLGGKAVQMKRPHRVRARVRIDPTDYSYVLAGKTPELELEAEVAGMSPQVAPAAEQLAPAADSAKAPQLTPAVAVAPVVAPAVVPAQGVSNVQRLLAAAGKELT